MNWIKLVDRLPNKDVKMIFWHKSKGTLVGKLVDANEYHLPGTIIADSTFVRHQTYNAEAWFWEEGKITHWCEIEEPKE